jgi:ABC-type transporter Mla maintaining outer membrane lipid asymmetry ATPase subunit MlaF
MPPLCVELRDVSLEVEGRSYLRHADLRVEAGESVVIAAPPGSGKSFVPRLLLGLPGMDVDQAYLSGQVRVDGQLVGELSATDLQLLRRRIGNVMRDGGLIENMDIPSNVALPLSYHYRDLLEAEEIAGRSRQVLSDLGVEHLGRQGLRPVSLHREQRIYASLARALVGEPFLLLADEPCMGLSPGPARQLCERLLHYEPRFARPLPGTGHGGRGLTRLVTTANLGPYLGLADRFLLLADGGLEPLGDSDAVARCDDPRVRALLEAPPTSVAMEVAT